MVLCVSDWFLTGTWIYHQTEGQSLILSHSSEHTVVVNLPLKSRFWMHFLCLKMERTYIPAPSCSYLIQICCFPISLYLVCTFILLSSNCTALPERSIVPHAANGLPMESELIMSPCLLLRVMVKMMFGIIKM